MILLLKVFFRVLGRMICFGWRGALTLFMVGMVCGMATGLIHLVIGFMAKDPFIMQQPSTAFFVHSTRLAIAGLPIGLLGYATAGVITSRHEDVDEVLVSLNLWSLPYGLIGATAGYVNAAGYQIFTKLLRGRPFSAQIVNESLDGWPLDVSTMPGFFVMIMLCAIVRGRKAMRETDKT